MNRDEQRESRTILRRIEAHLRQSHLDMGATEESISFVDVISHEGSSLRTLNYVTPRKNTAWVSGNHVQQGLEVLQEKGRRARVRFVEGLYPPVFVRALRDLGLHVEEEIPVMVYKKSDRADNILQYPADVSFTQVKTIRDLSIWWYVWRNAYYNVAVSSVEPLLIGRDMQDVYFGRQINLVMYRNSYAMGAIRLTMHHDSAHLVAHAMLKEMQTPEWDKTIRAVATDVAFANGADMIFVAGKTEAERTLYREMGFIDSGSIVSYAEDTQDTDKEVNDDSLAQSVLVV
ncbi:MAG: hypothetical protein WBC91_01205 [Phototrophicaceae bacterium]